MTHNQKTGRTLLTLSGSPNTKKKAPYKYSQTAARAHKGVGAGIAIFIQCKLEHQMRLTLHNSCSNNQAEQLAIVKVLETINKLHIAENIQREVTIYTDSRITLQSLKNPNNHRYLIEEIRKKAISLEKHNWKITFTWIQAHVGQNGNELAGTLAKDAV